MSSISISVSLLLLELVVKKRSSQSKFWSKLLSDGRFLLKKAWFPLSSIKSSLAFSKLSKKALTKSSIYFFHLIICKFHTIRFQLSLKAQLLTMLAKFSKLIFKTPNNVIFIAI